MKNIYMTGSTGKLGTHLISSGKVGGIFSSLENPTDLKFELAKIFEKTDGTVTILHAGAMTDVSACERSPSKALDVNTTGTHHLLNALYPHRHRTKFVYFSTCHVFGDNKYFPYSEKHKTVPSNAYGYSKLGGEVIVSSYHGVIDSAVFRFGKIVSQADIEGYKSLPSSTTVPSFIKRNFMTLEEFESRVMTLITLPFSKFPTVKQMGILPVLHVGTDLNFSMYQYVNYIRGIENLPPVSQREYEEAGHAPRPYRCTLDTKSMKRLLRKV